LVYGPNGFLRSFRGVVSSHRAATLDVSAVYHERHNGITLAFGNRGSLSARVGVLNKYVGRRVAIEVEPGRVTSRFWSLERLFGWYDFLISVADDPACAYHFAGHVETGRDSISDPALGDVLGGDGEPEGTEMVQAAQS
jgi:phospholipase C